MPRGSEEKDNWYLIEKVFISFCKYIWCNHIFVDMRSCKLSLCMGYNFFLIEIISFLDVADGISAQRLVHGGHSKVDEEPCVHTCREKNIRGYLKEQFFCLLTAPLGVIFLENFCLVTRRIHKYEGCILYTSEWPRISGQIAANIVTDRKRMLRISAQVKKCRNL